MSINPATRSVMVPSLPLPLISSNGFNEGGKACIALKIRGWTRSRSPRLPRELPGCTWSSCCGGPLAETGGANVLVGSEFVFLNDLLERGDGGDDGADRLRLSPVGITAAFCHGLFSSLFRRLFAATLYFITFGGSGDAVGKLVGRADAALDQATRRGRNRMVAQTSDMPSTISRACRPGEALVRRAEAKGRRLDGLGGVPVPRTIGCSQRCRRDWCCSRKRRG